MTGPCDWPVIWPSGQPCDRLVGLPSDTAESFISMASTYLWHWTGRRFGLCPVTVRPCRGGGGRPSTYWGASSWGPVLIGGSWLNVSCGRCQGACACDGASPVLRLPGPVASIAEVQIGSTVLSPEAYRVDNGSLLVRQDGQRWPAEQDLTAPQGAEDTFSITYLYGDPVPEQGAVAVGVLACEMAKASLGDTSCQLPRRLQSIARQGISMTFLDSMDDLDKGRTGLWLVDSWVASVMNPRVGGRVYSPDIPRPRNRVQTWT